MRPGKQVGRFTFEHRRKVHLKHPNMLVHTFFSYMQVTEAQSKDHSLYKIV